MHHPALSVHSAQNAHRQAGVAHSTHPPAVHKEARCRTGLEQPCRAGVKIHADEVQRGTALIVTFQGKGHVDQPCRQLCGKARLEQPGRQLGGKVAIHGCRPAGAHAVAQDHLRCRRAAELLHRIAGNTAPRRRARHAEHGPQHRLFAEQQGGHSLAGKHLRHFQRAAADAAHLPGQRDQLLRREAGARQRDRRMGAAQIIQRDGTLLRRSAKLRKKVRHPAGFIGFRVARTAQLFSQHAQRFGHGAVLLGQGSAHGFGMKAGLLAAAVQRKGAVCCCAQRCRVDAPG